MKSQVRSCCLSAVVAVAASALAPPAAEAQHRIFAQVTAGGTVISSGGHCSGDFLQVGGQDVQDFAVVHQAGAGATTSAGRLAIRPYRIVRPIDSCSPLFFDALVQAKAVTADIRFFRPDPQTGEDRHYYSVKLQNARVTAVTSAANAQLSSGMDPREAGKEIISFSFASMTLVDEIRSVSVVVAQPTH